MQVKDLRLKRALRAALLVLLLNVVGMGKMYADYYNVIIGVLRYDLNDNTLTATVKGHKNGLSATGSLIIPSFVTYKGQTYSVTTIGSSAFWSCDGFTGDLVIPNSVTTIGELAFGYCIGFTGILTIGNSVTSIGDGAFLNCSGFTGSLTIGNSVTSIGNYAFEGCSGFTGNLTIGNSVTLIGDRAFNNCSGFTGSLTIGNSVTTISGSAFYGCSGFLEVHYNATNCDDIFDIVAPFSYCGGTLVIGENVERIPNYLFEYANFTGDLVIPNSVTTIGNSAFQYCSGFTGNLTIGNSVTTIGSSAFQYCSGFTGNLTIGNSVTTIGNYAFQGCSGFTGSLTIPNSLTTIGSMAFRNCSGFTGSLTIGNSVTTIGGSAFQGCSGFTGSLTIPNSVTSIGSQAFRNCIGFAGNLTIGNSVTEIGSQAFYGCSGFTGSLIIPNSVTWISGQAFQNCSGFNSSLTIGHSVTTIGESAVSGCSGFTGSLTLGNSLTSIHYYAFQDCSGFTGELVIPNSVTWLGYSAFRNCTGFTGNLTIGNSIATIGGSAFYGCSGFTGSLTIGNSVTRIDNNAFQNCSSFTGNLVIPNSVTEIGSSAFQNCSGFSGSLTIPNSVTSISDKAFYGCCSIDEVIMLTTTPPTLGTNVFCTTNPNFVIYVPYEFLNAYKTANNWNYYEPYIKPMFNPSVSGYASSTSNEKWTFIALPLADETDPATVLNLLSEDDGYDLYQFDQSAAGEEWRNYKAGNFNLVNGRGYLYATAVDVNLVIGGDFNEDETKEVSLDYDAGKPFAGWNLVGNPFPVGAYINRSYYVMNATGSGIEPMAISSSIPVPVCTGVMVKAEASGESVTFNRTAPSNRIDLGRLQIELTESTPNRGGVSTGSTTLQDKAIISFNAGDRLEKYVFNKDNARISIPQGGKDLAIACTDKQGEMPLDFKATKNGSYTLSVDVENVDMDYLHLIDNLTGADIDLLAFRQAQGPAEYTFTAKTSDYASRFRLVFSVCGDADGDNAPFAFINNENIIIISAEAGALLQIVDMTGRVIRCTDVARNVSTNEMTPGVYVLRLINGNDVKTQKIVID